MKRNGCLRALCLLLSALLLCPAGLQAAALDTEDFTEDPELEALLAEFRAEYGLTEENFTMAYYNLETGEGAAWQYDQLMVAASTFKVPLAMLYYDKINAGEMTGETTVGGLQLDYALRQTIVYSDNDTAHTLMYAIGDNVWRNYRVLLTQYSDQDYADSFYSSNVMNCHYMIDCLTYLYENAEQYAELLDMMAEAQPGEYFQKYVTDYTVCHKYGYYEGAVNDVAIVYGPQTYVLAAYSQDVSNAADMLGELNRLICAYLEERAAEEAAEEEAAAQAAQEAAAEAAAQAEAEAAAQAAEEAAAAEEGIALIAEEAAEAEPQTAETEQAAEAVPEQAAEETGTSGLVMAGFALVAAGGAALLVALVWIIVLAVKRRRKK